jgi:hypothetical protein
MIKVLVMVLAALIGLALLAALVAYVIGRGIPREHVAEVEGVVGASCEQVFARITTVEQFPTWRVGLKSVERLAPDAWREESSHGSIRFQIEASNAPSRLVVAIPEQGLPFGGTWIYELSPEAAGCRVKLAEHGWVEPPIFRFVMRHVTGETKTLNTYLAALEKSFRS